MTKINLGCGKYKKDFDGWVNVDQNPEAHIQGNFIKHNITEPFTMFKNNSVDLVFSEHVMEHLDMHETCLCFKEMYRILKPESTLRIVVPDAIFRKHEPPEKFPCHGHKTAWTHYSLNWLLESIGFKVYLVKYWDDSGTQHTDEERFNLDFGPISRPNSLIVDGVK